MILRMRSTAWLATAAVALVLGACGGDRNDLTARDAAEPRSTPAPPAGQPREQTAEPDAEADAGAGVGVDEADVRVVRGWADTLRRGDVRGAARYFALPSTVANGTAPLKLETRAEALFFNRTLPCGARLIGTEPGPQGFFIATFRLTERPGRGECGSGTGQTARTAFRVRDDHITDWLRVQDVEAPPETLS
jgi:hypothetical protein